MIDSINNQVILEMNGYAIQTTTAQWNSYYRLIGWTYKGKAQPLPGMVDTPRATYTRPAPEPIRQSKLF